MNRRWEDRRIASYTLTRTVNGFFLSWGPFHDGQITGPCVQALIADYEELAIGDSCEVHLVRERRAL